MVACRRSVDINIYNSHVRFVSGVGRNNLRVLSSATGPLAASAHRRYAISASKIFPYSVNIATGRRERRIVVARRRRICIMHVPSRWSGSLLEEQRHGGTFLTARCLKSILLFERDLFLNFLFPLELDLNRVEVEIRRIDGIHRNTRQNRFSNAIFKFSLQPTRNN